MTEAAAQPAIHTEEDYYNLPADVRAELIHGQFYNMAAPSRIHQEILAFIFKKISYFIDASNGSCRVYPVPFAVKLFQDSTTIVEPDISVICDPNKLTDKGCSGAPDWIIEIVSPSDPGHDFIYKLNLYANAGVREYWIVNPLNNTLFVYHLENNDFKVSAYTFQDKVKVNIYDDFWIDFKELKIS